MQQSVVDPRLEAYLAGTKSTCQRVRLYDLVTLLGEWMRPLNSHRRRGQHRRRRGARTRPSQCWQRNNNISTPDLESKWSSTKYRTTTTSIKTHSHATRERPVSRVRGLVSAASALRGSTVDALLVGPLRVDTVLPPLVKEPRAPQAKTWGV